MAEAPTINPDRLTPLQYEDWAELTRRGEAELGRMAIGLCEDRWLARQMHKPTTTFLPEGLIMAPVEGLDEPETRLAWVMRVEVAHPASAWRLVVHRDRRRRWRVEVMRAPDAAAKA